MIAFDQRKNVEKKNENYLMSSSSSSLSLDAKIISSRNDVSYSFNGFGAARPNRGARGARATRLTRLAIGSAGMKRI